MNQDELKTLVGQAALQFVVPGQIVGVGTGSTVNKFIDALASIKELMADADGSSLNAQLARERDHFVKNLHHANAGIGISAFLNKQNPQYN